MRIRKALCAAAALGALVGGAATADVQEAVSDKIIYGISRGNADLKQYQFATGQAKTIGPVQDSDGKLLLGIEAAAYFPGLQNIYAMWTNPADGKNKLVYVNVASGAATIVAQDMEGGKFTGAVGVAAEGDPYAVFAVQRAKIKPPATITGLCNLNPSNATDNEFECTRGDGATFTRNDLHESTPTNDGVYYEGPATFIKVRPKGNGNQNGLIIDGQAFQMQNSNTYTFQGDMVVRVYNDKVNGGKNMGHWWLQVISGTVTLNGEAQVLTPNRLTKIDQRTGTVTEIMRLNNEYSGLASPDGKVFYTACGTDLYKIDTLSLTETKVGAMTLNQPSDMAFVESYMLAYDTGHTALVGVDETSAQKTGEPADVSLGDTSVILFGGGASMLHAGLYD